MSDTGLAREFAQRLLALQWKDLPPEAVHWARVGVLDTVGVTLAGCKEPSARIAAQSLDLAAGPSLLFGHRQRVGMLDAAFINGTAAHALDFDDCNNTIGGHPSAPVLPALFALAEARGASGRDFVTAYVAGFEMETKLGLAVNFHHYRKGWHPTATLGTFGAAAACAHLLKLDEEKTAVALALAATFASGIKANFGTMTKPMHVGHAARQGLLAARMAANGFTANSRDVFEHAQGWLDVFNGAGTYDVQRALDAWAKPLDIVAPGIAIKQYPCCGSTHPTLDAMLHLVRRHAPRAQDVERIDAAVHSRRLQHTNRPDPKGGLDAKFSQQYVLARALVDGAVGVADFEDEKADDARVRELMPRVHMTGYDESGVGGFEEANHFGGVVRITMKDGRVLEAQVEQPLGRTSANPLPEALLREKFRLCAQTALRKDPVAGVADEIWRVETLASVRELTGMIEQASFT
jgi:2-methylcitrate dehydratase PrpD